AAFSALLAAWHEQPEHAERLRELERLATAADRWRELVTDFAQRAAADSDGTADPWVRVGRWQLEQLQDFDGAVSALAQAHAKAPERDDVADLYTEALQRAERFSELTALMERRIASAADDARRTDLLQLAGELYERRTKEIDKAVATYWRAAQ